MPQNYILILSLLPELHPHHLISLPHFHVQVLVKVPSAYCQFLLKTEDWSSKMKEMLYCGITILTYNVAQLKKINAFGTAI